MDLQEARPEAEVEAAISSWVLGVRSSVERSGARTYLIPNTEHRTPVALLRSERQRHWIRFDRGRVSAAELIAAVSARFPVTDLAIEEPEIEGIIARIYREVVNDLAGGGRNHRAGFGAYKALCKRGFQRAISYRSSFGRNW